MGRNKIRGLHGLSEMSAPDSQNPGRYQCAGNDPQCRLQLPGRLSPGWYLLKYDIVINEGKILNPKFYLDTGSGFHEGETISLPAYEHAANARVIYLPKTVFHIRFDPTENMFLDFTITELTLERISTFDLVKRVYRQELALAPGANKIKKALKALVIVLTNRVEVMAKLLQHSNQQDDVFHYREWINRFDSYGPGEMDAFSKTQAEFSYRPKISILLPVYNTPLHWLQECIESVQAQVYDNWELCIADDHSPNEELRQLIRRFADDDKRVRFQFRQENGHIVVSSNTALSMATGDYVALLDHDDTLSPLALFRVVEALNRDRNIDFLYSDEDKIDEQGERSLPFFKPDWSPALFYTQNYITHLACIRKSLLASVGGFTTGAEGSQDYDLFLKVIAAGARIRHLPYILYHWRLHAASTSLASDSKPYAHTAGKAAVEKFLANKYPGLYNRVEDGTHAFTYLPRFNFAQDNKISIIIPTKDKIDYLRACIESIVSTSTWRNYEIIVLNNNSEEKESFAYFREVQEKYRQVRVIDAPFAFNWSKLNNFGAAHATGNFLVFLNNDVSIITPDWMERLCEYASLPDVAAVGPSLLYEDDTIQHAGVVVGMNGWADHVFKGMHPSHFPSPYVSNVLPRNTLAVTGACLAIERTKFEELGRFDEDFIICGSDVELGIRAYQRNYFNVIQSIVRLYHYESKSRGSFVPENDFIQSSIKYEPYRTQKTDPFFNPNLSLTDTSPTCKL